MQQIINRNRKIFVYNPFKYFLSIALVNMRSRIKNQSSSNIATKLQDLLVQHNNLTVSDLARLTNIPQPTLHRIISGKTDDPRISTLSVLAEFFGIQLDYFINSDPLEHQKKKPVNHIPLLEWSELNSINFNRLHECSTSWISTEIGASDKTFAIKSKKSTSDSFMIGSILIFDMLTSPQDGDIILYCYNNSTWGIRELVFDGPEKLLLPSNDKLSPILLNKKVKIFGVLVQTKFNYKK